MILKITELWLESAPRLDLITFYCFGMLIFGWIITTLIKKLV